MHLHICYLCLKAREVSKKMQIFLTIIHILACMALIVIVLLQSGKSAGLSGSIGGGAETFFGKNKGRTVDALLGKWTSVVAILFIVTSLILALFIR